MKLIDHFYFCGDPDEKVGVCNDPDGGYCTVPSRDVTEKNLATFATFEEVQEVATLFGATIFLMEVTARPDGDEAFCDLTISTVDEYGRAEA